ncbi:3-methyl-2-oxobutanoate hydroxymethyltransferase, partial [Staphylococcus aureus]|nr:3-methyl-2-oxobutanoate hydroxymethyltransferase [Staphylococcus aureus]
DIPVIGIGAGKDTDGQVLVYHDLLNYGVEHKAKFVKQYGDFSVGVDALIAYNNDVKSNQFPDENHTYKKRVMDEDTK